MNIEYEVTVLEIDKTRLINELEKLGAIKVTKGLQKRYTYDFNPKLDNKWIRLRTNGINTTLTIKEVFNKNIIGGTNELEINVSNFEKTNLILNELGYKSKNYQENYRITYRLNNINFDIDSWPLIPTYLEIEGSNEEEVKEMIKLLNIDKNKITTKDVTSIYNEIYNIDVLNIKELRF